MKTILLADDSSLTQEIIGPMIAKSGYRLVTVDNGEQAVNKCCEIQPDLVLMDLYMPAMDGFNATKKLREQGFTAPIVALTGSEKDADKVKAKQVGCNNYILKTLEMKEVEQIIDSYLYTAGGGGFN